MSIQRVDGGLIKSDLKNFERNRNSLRISNIKRYSTFLEKIKSKNNFSFLMKFDKAFNKLNTIKIRKRRV